ncbi:MAG TPA: DUF3037 domain-containing protein [Ktedonobacterales bacterium]|jgi:hypothetical protein
MPARKSFDYAIIRVVPLVERGEFINAGAILFCRAAGVLVARVALDRARLAALAPWLALDEIQEHLDAIPLICAGVAEAGPIARLSQSERFHWLVAPRSTVIQTSPVHSGMTANPAAALDHILATLVLPPEDGGGGAMARE